MRISRRDALKLLGVASLALGGIDPADGTAARADDHDEYELGLRTCAAGDAAALSAIMTSCVNYETSFYGKCGVWPLSWAEEFVQRCPQSPVLTRAGEVIAFFEVPPIKPLPASGEGATGDAAAQALRERKRVTYRVNAAGMRYDQVDADDVVLLFRTLIYEGFKAARAAGYEYVEAWAPWQQHPMMARKWTDYPGCELAEPVAHNMESGHDIYILRWHLEPGIAALAEEERYHVA